MVIAAGVLASAASCTRLNRTGPVHDASVHDGGSDMVDAGQDADALDASGDGSMDADTPPTDAGELVDASMNDDAGDAAMDAEPAPNRGPTVSIDFPVSGVVDRAQVRVRGRVSDPDGDTLAVTVAGASAEVEDGVYGMNVALAEGANAIEVAVSDGRGGEASASVSIERRGALFGSPFDLAVHAESNTAWIADYFVGVIELDLETGSRRVLDGLGPPGEVATFLSVAVAPDGSRIFASGSTASEQPFVMERARDGATWSLLSAEAGLGLLRVDPVRNSLIVVGAQGVSVIDLTEGASRGTVSPIASAETGPWTDYRSESHQLLNAQTYVVGTADNSSIDQIDLATGVATRVWSSPTGVDFVAASGVAFSGSSAYVADWGRGTIHTLNLSTGTLSEYSGSADFGPQLMLPEAMVRVDTTLYVIDSGLSALLSITGTGARSVLSGRGTGSGQGFFGPTGLTFDASGDRFLVMDSDPRAGFLAEGTVPSRASLTQVDRRTGNRRVISGEGAGTGALLPWGSSVAMHPSGVALATTNSMSLLSSGPEAGALLEIDLESGDRRVVSGASDGATVVGTGPSLDTAVQVLIESETHALVLQRSKIVRVHLPTGNRVIISGPDGADVQGSGPGLSSATGFVLDGRSDPPLAYVTDREALFEIDIGSGDRRVLSTDTDEDAGPGLKGAGGIALDAARERVIVVTPELIRGRDVFIEVSLTDGTRQFLSADDAASAATRQDGEATYQMASGLYLDEEARTLWAIDWSLRSLQVLDADTGETVLFSHFGR